jgi:TonB family protein
MPAASGFLGMVSMQGENFEPQINLDGLAGRPNYKRHRQMVLALAMLFTALILLGIRYRTSWFDTLTSAGVADQTGSDATQGTVKPIDPTAARKGSSKRHASSLAAEAETVASPSVQDTVLPPLQVDVTYSNGSHQTLIARDSAVRLSLSAETAEVLVRPVEPVYPMLAEQSNVQGSVVLLARVDKDGTVESVQVVSGPQILANAAVEAVKQWRFKPRPDVGPGMSSESRITVNFNISTQ